LVASGEVGVDERRRGWRDVVDRCVGGAREPSAQEGLLGVFPLAGLADRLPRRPPRRTVLERPRGAGTHRDQFTVPEPEAAVDTLWEAEAGEQCRADGEPEIRVRGLKLVTDGGCEGLQGFDELVHP